MEVTAQTRKQENTPKDYRAYNFSPGPACLPTAVLEKARSELLNWHDTGCSVMEVSHRSKGYIAMAEEVEADLRELMKIPDNYHVLFIQGGGKSQFSMAPLNLLGDKQTADYVDTGIWSKHAIKEAQRYCKVNIITDNNDSNCTTIPDQSTWQCNPDAAYLHYVSNETINGVEFHDVPKPVGSAGVPLVSDMSSNILSCPLDVSKFGLIYAGTQKNMGPAGMAVAIIRKDLVGHAHPMTPSLYDYKTYADSDSMYNTPPTYTWYMVGLVLKWLKQQGGLEGIAEVNARKAKRLYDFIDASDFYHNPVDVKYRSRMNVVFTLQDGALDATFLEKSQAAGLAALKGHRIVGGMRASIYNAMPESGIEALIAFMQDFEKNHG